MIRFCRKTGRFSAPYSVNISVTEKCPLRCHFCFHEYDNNKELDYKKLIGYLDEMTSLGVVQVQFSGGEPLIYPHIFDAIRNNGICTGRQRNG